MNILIFNWRDPANPLSGGAEISLMEHAKYWTGQGAKVTWFSSSFKTKSSSGMAKNENINGIKIIRKGNHYTTHIWAFLYFLQKKFGSPDTIIDCFHFVPFFTPLYIKNTKIIALINEPAKNAWFKNIFFPLNIFGYLLEPLFFIPYKKIAFITASESIAQELTKYRLDKNKINIIHHGTKLPETKLNYLKEKNPTLIYLGQISPDKGIEDAIKAFTIIINTIPNTKLWIVGKAISQNYLAKIKQKINEKNLQNSITFFGYVNENKKNELLAKAWILIHPSIREGWGLNIIEAAAAGTPAVGYNIVGLRDSIISNQTGLLVKKNINALTEAVYNLITGQNALLAMSKKAVKWSQNFSWQKSAQKSWNIIKSK